MSIQIQAVTPALWPEVGRAFGPGEKKSDSCWCQRFRRHDEPDNRSALRREVLESDVPVGLAAVDDGRVIGWTRVPSPSAVFTGTASMFRTAGFSEIGRTYRSRPVMNREC